MNGRSVEELVSRQVSQWQEQKKERHGKARLPCVVFSREYGTNGGLIAREVAKHLGFQCYDKEILDEIARSANVTQALLDSVDERARDQITEWIAEQFGTHPLSGSEFVRLTTRLIMTIGHNGGVVIVGRGAHFLLDARRTLRVRAFAPVEVRVLNVMKMYGLSEEEARDRVMQMDKERRLFYIRFFSRDWEEIHAYDLLLNTASYTLEGCALVTLEAFKKKFGVL
jgi:cytidylate kinase